MTIESDVLWHYTSVEAAHCILKSFRIWATDYRYLNDKNELIRSLEDFLNYIKEKESIEVFNGIKHVFYQFQRSYSLTVFSLSKSDKVLSQWRAYADNGKGVAIGISRRWFDLLMANHEYQKLVECIYEKHDEAISKIYEENKKIIIGLSKLSSEANSASSFRQLISSKKTEIDRIFYQLLSIKNPAFSEEKEVRFITSKMLTGDTKTRVRDGVIIPYEEVTLSPECHY